MNKKVLGCLLIVFLVGLFCYRGVGAKEFDLVINEVAWMGTEVSSSDEWIELWNRGDGDVILDGFILKTGDEGIIINLSGSIAANSYYLLERTDDHSVEAEEANQIYSGSLSNGGEDIYLIDTSEDIIDSISMAEAWQAGDNELKLTMQKIGDAWTNSSSVGGSPKQKNEANDNLEENISQQEGDDSSTSFFGVKIGDVLISEIVSDPEDGEEEWIELYNTTNKSIDLNNWFIEEGSGSKTMLNDFIEHFFVVENIKGNLNNSGDSIYLKDSEGRVIDNLVYGDENGMAQIASDPDSLARKDGSKNTYNSSQDFFVTSIKTKGSKNMHSDGSESLDANSNTKYDYSSGLLISEILPNPDGEDERAEFIELYNDTENDINLYRWRIGDNSQKEYVIKEKIIINPGEYKVFYREKTKIALNNNGDTVKLFQPLKEEVFFEVSYSKSEVSKSYNYDFDYGRYSWSNIATPNGKNEIQKTNYAPSIDFEYPSRTKVGEPFFYDASDCSDLNDDQLSFVWDFGNGVVSSDLSLQHAYWEAGEYLISLSVSDGENIVKQEETVVVESVLESFLRGEASIELSRFEANPEGLDSEGEWIEVVNSGETKVNIKNWQIDDRLGGSRPYVIKDDIWLDPGELFIIDREDSKIALNNTVDEVRLIDSSETVVDTAFYKKATEGVIFYKKDGEWSFEDQNNSKANVEKDKEITQDKLIVEDTYQKLSIEDLEYGIVGEAYQVQGVVTTLPGHVSSQSFYIYDKKGLEIYSFHKRFLEGLELGDVVLIKGVLSRPRGANRLKIKEAEDVLILSKEKEVGLDLLKISDIDEGKDKQLVKISAKVDNITKEGVILEGNNGSQIILKYNNVDLRELDLEEGRECVIKGFLLRKNKDKYLYLRESSDIVLISHGKTEDGRVMGEYVESSSWELAGKNNEKQEMINITFLVTFLFICLILGVKIYKNKNF